MVRWQRWYWARRQGVPPGEAWLTRLGLPLVLVLGVGAALLALGWSARYARLAAGLPRPEALLRWVDPVQGLAYFPTRLESRYGSRAFGAMQPEAVAQARYVSLANLPPHVRTALEAALDPRVFPEAPRPALDLARLLLPQAEATDPALDLLARQLEATYPPERLLEWWLNLRPFGPGVYGLDAAAWAYFDRPVHGLDWSQATWLAVRLRWPQMAEAQLEEQRQALVRWLEGRGRLSTADLAQARRAPQPGPLPVVHPSPTVRTWMDLWSQQPLALPERGRQVRITILGPLQQALTCVVEEAFRPEQGPCPGLAPWPEAPLPAQVGVEAIILEPEAGEVLAHLLAGSRTQPDPLPLGTALAPWVYAAAFSRGYTPAGLFWDVPAARPLGAEEVRNHDGRFHGPVQWGQALANTWEVPLAVLAERLGTSTLVPLFQAMALPAPEGLQGGSWFGEEVALPPAMLAHHLGLFATQGRLVGLPQPDGSLAPRWFAAARDLDGSPIALPEATTQNRLSPALAYLVTYALAKEDWREPPLNQVDLPEGFAVYLGRAAAGRVVWALGYAPQRVVVVALDGRGADMDPTYAERVSLLLWQRIARLAQVGMETTTWPVPQEVRFIPVCVPSGQLPDEDCPQIARMPFLDAFQPQQLDTLYQRVPVNARTGRLATVFTPPEAVEYRTYLVAPPETRRWAQENGWPQPPTEYDVLRPPRPSVLVQMTEPAPFAYVSGTVEVRGTAEVVAFRSYRVQVGRGLFPERWQVLAQGEEPVRDGVLARWDTRSWEEGLYVLQLQVVDEAGRLQSHTLQVTVDNTPPQVRVLAPEEGQARLWNGRFLYFEVEVRENLELAWLTVRLDGEPVMQMTEGPFRGLIPASPGRHVLTFIARDRAGNLNTARVTVEARP